jgi:adenylylsulfate kinase
MATSTDPGFVLWFTGMSGAGKTTLATLVTSAISVYGRKAELLDGDQIRASLSPELGFSQAERELNVRRIGYVANLLARNSVAAVVAAISPYAKVRDAVRAMSECGFVEVFVDCSIDELRRRDTKGLYARAADGRLMDLSGVGSAYEPPAVPDLHLRTHVQSEAECASLVLSLLAKRGLIK